MNHWIGRAATTQAGIQIRARGFVTRRANHYVTEGLAEWKSGCKDGCRSWRYNFTGRALRQVTTTCLVSSFVDGPSSGVVSAFSVETDDQLYYLVSVHELDGFEGDGIDGSKAICTSSVIFIVFRTKKKRQRENAVTPDSIDCCLLFQNLSSTFFSFFFFFHLSVHSQTHLLSIFSVSFFFYWLSFVLVLQQFLYFSIIISRNLV